MASYRDLVAQLIEGGDNGRKAATIFGILLERWAGKEEDLTPDGGLSTLLRGELRPEEIAQLSPDTLVALLSNQIVRQVQPDPTYVWALSRSRHPMAEQILYTVLRRILADPNQEPAARQALLGLASYEDELAQSAIEDAALRGSRAIQILARGLMSRSA